MTKERATTEDILRDLRTWDRDEDVPRGPDGLLGDAADEIEQLRGNLSLAEEGLASATQEIERLRGIKPELPPRPPDEGDQALPRYGIRWNDKGEPLVSTDGRWLLDAMASSGQAHSRTERCTPHCPTCLCGIGHCPKHPAAIFHPPAACPECASGNAAYSIEGMMAAEKSLSCDCPEVCKVCGGRAKACALLGHRSETDRSVKWHECAQGASRDASSDDPNKVNCFICGKLWGEHSSQEQADCSAAL